MDDEVQTLPDEQQQPKVLTNKDILASQGLIEIYDPTVGAKRQLPKEEAKKLIESLEQLKQQVEG
ncbi:MAG: hypothetical protein M3Q44_03985 [bacterium]|nr:hypothetical protein [bacterium]